jgi:hypothetical protein
MVLALTYQGWARVCLGQIILAPMARYRVVPIVDHILLAHRQEWSLDQARLLGQGAIPQTVSLRIIAALLDRQPISMVSSTDWDHVDLVCQIHRQAADLLVMVYVDNPLVDLDPLDHQDHLRLRQALHFLLLVLMDLLLV